MRSSRGVLGLVLAGGFLLFDCQRAQATAISFSDITVSNLQVAPASGSIVFDVFTTYAFAQAQNSLGELNASFDAQSGLPAQADTFVTWADAHAFAGGTQWSASSNVNLSGGSNFARSAGQGLWSNMFMITGGTGTVTVNVSADVSGQLSLLTDAAGQVAQTETIFNLLLDGFPILFLDQLQSIGPNDSFYSLFANTLTNSVDLQFDTPYSLLLRVDSESETINAAPIPEPSTVTMVGLGLGAVLARRRRLRASRHLPGPTS
jgi:hypothetical protein